jgi:coenzyme Q-binding protein COQ10
LAVHRVTKILPWTPAQLAELVADVRAYPDFVPWVTAMRVWNERDSFLRERFSTWSRHDRNRNTVEVGLIRGPFRHLKNRWEFHPDPAGTRVDFMIDFAFKSRLLDGMLHANFDRAVSKLMACFEARAASLYGPKG